MIERKDIWKTEGFPVWRIETGKLLQKFDPVLTDVLVHKSASVVCVHYGLLLKLLLNVVLCTVAILSVFPFLSYLGLTVTHDQSNILARKYFYILYLITEHKNLSFTSAFTCITLMLKGLHRNQYLSGDFFLGLRRLTVPHRTCLVLTTWFLLCVSS